MNQNNIDDTSQFLRIATSAKNSFQSSSISARSSVVSTKSRNSSKQMTQMLFVSQFILYKLFDFRVFDDFSAELNVILHDIEERFSKGIAVVFDAYEMRTVLPRS